MEIQNSELIERENNVFSILGLVTLPINGPYEWHIEDINEESVKGTIFRAFELKNAKGSDLELASISVVDVTNDPDEPDVSKLEQTDVLRIDNFMRENFLAQLASEERFLTKWMASQLNEAVNFKGLVTAYKINDQGKEYQFIAVRINVKGRKIVGVGTFDTSKSDELASFIFNAMSKIGLRS